MLDFLIDNIFVTFGGAIFQQQVGIPMGTNCAPLLADLFLYSYETEFNQNLVKNWNTKDAKSLNLTYRRIDDVLSINILSFGKWLQSIYQPELEIKGGTETDCSASFWTYISKLTTVVISALRFMINEKILILISIVLTCAAIHLHLLHMVFIFYNWFSMLEQALATLISFNTINFSITDSWIRGMRKCFLKRSLTKFFWISDIGWSYSVSSKLASNDIKFFLLIDLCALMGPLTYFTSYTIKK